MPSAPLGVGEAPSPLIGAAYALAMRSGIEYLSALTILLSQTSPTSPN